MIITGNIKTCEIPNMWVISLPTLELYSQCTFDESVFEYVIDLFDCVGFKDVKVSWLASGNEFLVECKEDLKLAEFIVKQNQGKETTHEA
jgi:hypothetical protein